jgi:hypothetical protein
VITALPKALLLDEDPHRNGFTMTVTHLHLKLRMHINTTSLPSAQTPSYTRKTERIIHKLKQEEEEKLM